jgi:hypothetical protein
MMKWQESLSLGCADSTEQREAWAEIEQLQGIVNELRGGIADLQRHVKARSEDEPPMFIPASMCAVIGAMHKVTEAAQKAH